jgi:hypothetical protein
MATKVDQDLPDAPDAGDATVSQKIFGHQYTQSVQGRIAAENFFVAAAFYAGKLRKFIHIDLSGTSVGPGSLTRNQEDIRGFFLDQVQVKITTEPVLELVFDEPYAANAGEADTHSVSFQDNVAGGVMAGQPLAQVGAGFSEGDTRTHQITDFSALNQSKDGYLLHYYNMTSDGYDVAHYGVGILPPEFTESGGDAFVDGLNIFNKDNPAYTKTHLKHLPLLATSNFPVVSQGIWRSKDDTMLNGQVRVSIEVTGRFVIIQGQKPSTKYERAYVEHVWRTQSVVDLSAAVPAPAG